MKKILIKNYCLAFCVVLTCLFFGGCMLGPDYERPQTAADVDMSFVNSPADANEFAAVTGWWRNVCDPLTEELVSSALANNQDLKVAAARVVESQALLAGAQGRRLPDITYAGSRNRSKVSFNLPTGRASFISQTYSQNISISYIADIFGKLKRGDMAAAADLAATEEDRLALTHSIVAQVVRTRINIATQQSLLAIAEANVESLQRTFGIVERRYQQGLANPLAVHLAKENLASAKAITPTIRQTLTLSQHSLDVLLGKKAATTAILPGKLADLPQDAATPSALPVYLLDRRPDVRASEMRLSAATNRVGVSIASLYPDLTFSASGGISSDSFSEIFDDDGEIYSAVFSLASPIWRGGQLRAQIRAAKARATAATENYAKTVLVAIREVEDALVSQRLLAERIDYLKVSVDEAYKAEELARSRYGRGVEGILTLLETERRRRNVENLLALSEGDLFNARVDLYLALGGDWDVELYEAEGKDKQKEHEVVTNAKQI